MQLGLAVLICAALVGVSECRRGLFSFGQFQRMYTGTSPPPRLYTSPEPKYDDSSEMEDDEKRGWPYAIMEFSSLVGRCVTAEMIWDMHSKPADGVLVHACPHVMKAAKHYAEADEPTRDKAEKIPEEIFHLLQCVNLAAERENVEYMLNITGSPKPDLYKKESKRMFDLCDRVFENADKYIERWTEKFDMELTSPPPSRSLELEQLLRKMLSRSAYKKSL